MIEKMRERITIEKSEGARDKNGNHKLVWKEYHSCYAYVNNLSGKEYWAASEVNAQDEVNFVIRYCEKIKDLEEQLTKARHQLWEERRKATSFGMKKTRK